MQREYLEDYEIGETILSPARTITETDVVHFAMLTGDWNPLHTDAVYAATTPFGERIAHGLLVLAVGSALGFRLGPHVVAPKSFIALYGFEEVRFRNPVRIGDTVHLGIEVAGIEEKDERCGILRMHNRILDTEERPCVEYTTRYLCGRRPLADGQSVQPGPT